MRKLKLAFAFALSIIFMMDGMAQNPGDTIIVQSLNFSSNVRDTIISFPNASLTYEKIYMLYSMRCKNAQVSSGTDRNKGCGEWDYSCNTYIHDSIHADSTLSTHPDYIISGFSGTTFDYVTSPTYDYYQTLQTGVTLDSIISDTSSTIGTGTLGLDHVFHTDTHAGKSQYLFTQTALSAAGVSLGNLDGLSIQVSNNPTNAKFLRVRLKETSKTVLNDTTPDINGFTEVYYHNTLFTGGANRLHFHTPFNWNGTSNLIVEFSFTNKTNGTSVQFTGNSSGSGLLSYGDVHFNFNGSNFIKSQSYKGISGSANRTVEAWIKTTSVSSEIVSFGNNASGEKWLLRLDGSGKFRVEVNSGFAVSSTVINDGKWHHVAVVLDGTNTTDLDLYVDGQKEIISNVGARTINTVSSINVRVGRGFHNKNWVGQIDEVRIWSSALSGSEISQWMYRSLESSHTSYSDLELYYPLSKGTGTYIPDASGNSRSALVNNGAIWSKAYGIDHFKNLKLTTESPNVTFHQGVYNTTIVNDTLIDSVMRPPNYVNQYQIFPKPGTVQNDSIGIISSNTYWEAIPENIYDPSGNLVSSIFGLVDGTINISDLSYFARIPSKFEIMSFVTPYGIGLDLGVDGETWVFDVSDFAPILKGNRRLTIERGGQWQEELDIKFMYIVGTPPRDVLDIQQIWKVDKKTFASIDNDNSYEPRDVQLLQAKGYKLRSAITGHGQEGEFIARTHYLNLNGGNKEFTWQVWKECAFNPVYPQGGTWVYDRAGWCPGMATDVKEFDITSLVTSGQTVNIDYGVNTATGSSSYIVNNQLVTYGDANFALDAAIVDILTPTSKIEYGRSGKICQGPVVKIQNTGSTTLTSLTINYWINSASSPEIYNWTGSLEFMETQEVNLPSPGTFWQPLTGTNDQFYVEVMSPNGGSDAYSHNNKMHSTFDIPEVLPADFYIQFGTNLAGYENSYKLFDEWGNIIMSRSGMNNNTTYRDTVSLPNGCYTLQVDDTGNDGISWWANNDGVGQFILRNSLNNLIVKSFNGDFGGGINYQFTVNYPLTYEELNPITETIVYPNPAMDKITVEGDNLDKLEVLIYNAVGQLMQVDSVKHGRTHIFNTSSLSEGIYYIQIKTDSNTEVKKVVIL